VDNIVNNSKLGMELVEMTGAGWSCSDVTLTCNRTTLGAGATATITVKARVGSGVTAGALTNTASVSTSTPGDDPDDNSDSTSVTVNTRADLGLTKVHDGDGTVIAGQNTSYRLTVKNTGPSDAQGPITITDTLPTDFSFVSSSSPWSCTPSGSAVTCEYADTLVAGTTAPELVMTVLVAANADTATPAVNSAVVSSSTTDPDVTNNDANAEVDVNRATNLSISKSHVGNPPIGSQVSFNITAHNDGPSTARDVQVTDTLPSGLTYVSASGTGWSCTFTDPTITCDLSNPLAAESDSTVITVVAEVELAAYPWVNNLAEVSTSTSDTDPSDNQVTDRVNVPARTDLSITKQHEGAFRVGSNGTYTLAVHNDGPTEAPGSITVTDVLPSGLSFISGSGPGWTCGA
ncbi:MAG TPA: hypothetical protein PKX56_10200, partial [Marmoricola sp.]|nr:hypothetical protein [Marmoricola sp.]